VSSVVILNLELENYVLQKKLHTLTLESDRLKQETSSRAELLTRIDAETKMVEEERVKAENINKKYRQQLSDYRVSCYSVSYSVKLCQTLPYSVIPCHACHRSLR